MAIMAYKNNGNQRANTLTIQVTINGAVVNTLVYLIENSFTQAGVTYAAITDTQLAQLDEGLYETRLNAFCDWIEAQNPGLTTIRTIEGSATDNVPQRTNTTSCPIGG